MALPGAPPWLVGVTDGRAPSGPRGDQDPGLASWHSYRDRRGHCGVAERSPKSARRPGQTSQALCSLPKTGEESSSTCPRPREQHVEWHGGGRIGMCRRHARGRAVRQEVAGWKATREELSGGLARVGPQMAGCCRVFTGAEVRVGEIGTL